MNRSRMFLLAAVAFLVAVGVAAFTYQALSNRLRPPEDTTDIVVAALPVSIGTKLTEADVVLVPFPKAHLPEGTLHSVAEAIGRGVLESLVPNEPILAKDLAAEGSGAGLMSTIPEGMRAVGVKVNDVIAVAGFVRPGSRVDVILSGSPTSLGNMEMAKVILEAVQVIAVDQSIESDDAGRPQNAQVVALLVTPEQSEALALASVDGRLQLALRNPLDLEEMKPIAVRREQLFLGIPGSGSSVASVPPPVAAVRPVARTAPRQQTTAPVAQATPAVIAPPPPPEVMASPPPKGPTKTIELINGDKKETYEFPATTGTKEPSGK